LKKSFIDGISFSCEFTGFVGDDNDDDEKLVVLFFRGIVKFI
jgi:hypothetical protein